ncbi:MAG: helix-turn-helix domain-containing protein [Patescibacteria group bacterium]|jgi:sugar-specific transcriptional regulator TrmB
MQLDILKKVGLTDQEINIYSALLEGGELPAHEIIKRTGLKKGDCYNKIYALKGLGFIEEFSKQKKKHFRLAHPEKIREYTDAQIHAASLAEREINAVLPSLISAFNLTYHKPGVQVMEGIEGIKKLYEDTIQENKPIYSFLEANESNMEIWKWLRDVYVKQRVKAEITARVIVSAAEDKNTAEYISHDAEELRETRIVKKSLFPCKLEIQVYGNKVSFANYNKGDVPLAVIIDNKSIAESMRGLFELAWKGAEKQD